jgi:hypothetical protein
MFAPRVPAKALERELVGDLIRSMATDPLKTRWGFYCGRLPKLGPIFEKWTELQSLYHSANKEGPFVYRERSQIGLLSAAIWASGGIALEEWQSEKVRTGGKEAVESYSGRCDLWFTTHSKSPGKHGGWFLEAKHRWINANRLIVDLGDPKKTGLGQAVDAAKQHTERANRLGCSFVSVFVDRKRKEHSTEQYRRLPDELRTIKLGADVVAWYGVAPDALESQWKVAPDSPRCSIATIVLISRC